MQLPRPMVEFLILHNSRIWWRGLASKPTLVIKSGANRWRTGYPGKSAKTRVVLHNPNTKVDTPAGLLRLGWYYITHTVGSAAIRSAQSAQHGPHRWNPVLAIRVPRLQPRPWPTQQNKKAALTCAHLSARAVAPHVLRLGVTWSTQRAPSPH